MANLAEKKRQAVARAFAKWRRKSDQSKTDGTNAAIQPSQPAQPTNKVLAFSRCTFIASLFIGALRMMGAVSFGWVATLGYVLFVLSFIEVWFEPLFKKRFLRPFLTLVVFGGCVLFSLRVVFVDAPLQITASTNSMHYPTGTLFEGIVWKSYFSDLCVHLINATNSDYEDLDIELGPDELLIAFIKQMDTTPSVTFIPFISVDDATIYKSAGSVEYGIKLAIPTSGRQVNEPLLPSYRLRCPKLPAHGSIVVVIATVNRDGLDKELKWKGPLRAPLKVSVSGHYKGFMRDRNIKENIKVFQYPENSILRR